MADLHRVLAEQGVCLYPAQHAIKTFFDTFTRDAEKHREILRDRFIRREVKRMLNNDVPYSPLAGLLEPKAEPVEEFHGDYCFMYKEEGAFIQGD